MPPKRTARSASRRSTPSSPPKAQELTRSPRQTRQSTREQSQELGEPTHSRRNNRSLPTVREEADPINASNESHRSESIGDSDDGNASELSSDEDYSSEGSEEFNALDRDLMIDNLQPLYNDTEAILSLIKPRNSPTTLKEARDPRSTTSKRLINFNRRLNVSLEPFENRLLLRTGRLTRRLGKRQRQEDEISLSDGKWRPDPILMKINLALLVLRLLSYDEPAKQGEERRAILQYLADTDPFPAPFVRPSSPNSKQTDSTGEGSSETAKIWVSILTHWFLLSASAMSRNKAAFDPDQMLTDTFWDAQGTLRLLSTTNEQIQEEASSLLEQRANEIRQHFSTTTKNPMNFKTLSRQFPWDDFVEEMTQWAGHQNINLNQQIEAVGGVEAIQDALNTDDYTPFPKPEPETSKKIATRSSFGKRFERMRRRDVEHSAKKPLDERTNARQPERDEQAQRDASPSKLAQSPEAGYATAEEMPADSTNDEEVNPVTAEVGLEEDPIPTQATNVVLDIVASQAKESNKENIPTPQRRHRLLDHQPDAVRETWSSPEPTVSPAKRRAQKQQQNEDEDDEFEVDRRTPKRARTSAGKARAERQRQTTPQHDNANGRQVARSPYIPSSRSRTRRQLPSEFTHINNEDNEEEEASAATTRAPVSGQPSSSAPLPRRTAAAAASTHPPDSEPEYDEDDQPPPSSYQEVKQRAKANVAMARLANPYARSTPIYTTHPATTGPIFYPQSRRAWSADEVTALIEGVATCGCRWAQILAWDGERARPRLHGRNQVQLKDKARNIKLDFLKSRQPLPPGFNAVTISKGHKEMLTAMGMPYVEGNFGDEYTVDD